MGKKSELPKSPKRSEYEKKVQRNIREREDVLKKVMAELEDEIPKKVKRTHTYRVYTKQPRDTRYRGKSTVNYNERAMQIQFESEIAEIYQKQTYEEKKYTSKTRNLRGIPRVNYDEDAQDNEAEREMKNPKQQNDIASITNLPELRVKLIRL